MRYDVHTTHENGGDGRFTLERDEPLTVGEYVRNDGMSYTVTAVRGLGAAESGEFDAVVEARWRLGPVVASFHQSM